MSDKFPVDALPKPLKLLAEQGAKANCCPPDFIALPALVVLGSAIGNKRTFQFKDGWKFKPNLYAGVIGSTGSAKSPSQKIPISPMKKEQEAFHEIFKEKYRQWELSGKKSTAPVMQELYNNDSTVEALAQSMEHNKGEILLIKDELTGLVKSLNQYRGGRGADREHYLSFWSGSNIKINRVGSLPLLIGSPFLSVIGGITPNSLKILIENPDQIEDGFIQRFLFVYPDPINDRNWTEDIINPVILKNYENLYKKLRELPERTKPLTLAKDAHKYWITIHNNLQREMQAYNFPHYLTGVWAKMPSQLARLVLIIHSARYVNEETTSENVDLLSLVQANILLDYFKRQSEKVYKKLIEFPITGLIGRIRVKYKEENSINPRQLISDRIFSNKNEVITFFYEMQSRGQGKVLEPMGKKGYEFVFS